MTIDSLSPEPSLRAQNMTKRRDTILSQARKLIAGQGFEALKLRELAQLSGISVPTIYNLIGGKQEILTIIIEDLVTQLQAVQRRVESDNIEAAFEAQINGLARLFGTDQDYYRAAFIAGDRSGLFEQSSDAGIFARSVQLPIDACNEAKKAGLLRGKVSAEQLGRQIYGCYRLARQDWVNGYFGLDVFRTQALTGVYLCLAADATDDFRNRLSRKIAVIT